MNIFINLLLKHLTPVERKSIYYFGFAGFTAENVKYLASTGQ